MKKAVLVKISGELFSGLKESNDSSRLSKIKDVIDQIKTLHKTHTVGIVIGGGAFFRGDSDGKLLQIKPTTAHTVGMLATMMNGLILQDFFTQHDISSTLLSAIPCSLIARTMRQKNIDDAIKENKCIIFIGGTGNPFVTTDTTAVIRALQIGATEMWKATKVDGIFEKNPMQHPNLKLIPTLKYEEVLAKNLKVLDATAVTLAQKHKMKIRVFNLFHPNALQQVLENPNFGSTIN